MAALKDTTRVGMWVDMMAALKVLTKAGTLANKKVERMVSMWVVPSVAYLVE